MKTFTVAVSIGSATRFEMVEAKDWTEACQKVRESNARRLKIAGFFVHASDFTVQRAEVKA